MKSTKFLISNEKISVSLPTIDVLQNQSIESIGTGQALIWYPALQQLAIGDSGTSIYELDEFTAGTDGGQSIALPINGAAIISLTVLKTDGTCKIIYPKYYQVNGNQLVIAANATIVTGDKICGSYYRKSFAATVPIVTPIPIASGNYITTDYISADYIA